MEAVGPAFCVSPPPPTHTMTMDEKRDKTADVTLKATMAPDEMPRERFRRLGPRSVTDVELIAIMLRTGTQGMNVMEMARLIYDTYGGDIARMGEATLDELQKGVKGMGEAKAIAFAAALELGRRRQYQEVSRKALTNSEDAYRFFRSTISAATVEEFHVAVLDAAAHVIHTERVSQGGLVTAPVDVRVVMQVVIRWGGPQFMVAHNHPAGSTQPSRADRELTARIEAAAKVLGVKLVDHIIVAQGRGENGYYSFCDNNEL